MELKLTLRSGVTYWIGLQPGDSETLRIENLPEMTVELIPDCEEWDQVRRGDCDGPTLRRQVKCAGNYNKLVGEMVWLCGSHGRQAAARGTVVLLP